jgi:citrate lyase beta subunit
MRSIPRSMLFTPATKTDHFTAQIPVINAAFTPDQDQIAWARQVINANQVGVGTVAGSMVDEAVARRARRILHSTHH